MAAKSSAVIELKQVYAEYGLTRRKLDALVREKLFPEPQRTSARGKKFWFRADTDYAMKVLAGAL